MLNIISEKVTTQPDDLHWGTCFSENGLFILLEIEGDDTTPAPQKGKEILDLVLTKVTNYKERNLTAMVEVADWAKENKFIKTLTLGCLQDNILYLVNTGTGEVLIKRDGKTGKILSSSDTSSGRVENGDVLLFSTRTFVNLIPNEKQKEIMQTSNISDSAEMAYSMLLGNTEFSGAAALLLKLSDSVVDEVKDVESQTTKTNYLAILRQKIVNLRENIIEDNEEAKPKKTLLTIAVILIALLFLSIFLNISHSQSTSKLSRLKQTEDLVSHQYDEAASLIDLNPARARLLLSDSKISMSGLLKDFPKNSKEYKEINDWIYKITQKEVDAYKIYKYTTVPLFFDIELIKKGGTGTSMILDKTMSVILDSKNKTVYSLSLDTKQANIIAGSEVVKDVKAVGVHGALAYLLNSDGVIQVDITSKTAQTIVKQDSGWGDISQIVAFGGNLYLLDRKNNTIWKYIAQETGFSPRTVYLNPDVRVALNEGIKMVIDGSVWVVTDPATILKFTSGRGDTFAMTGVSDTVSAIKTIFVSDETKNVYILDKSTKRILVFDKQGEYQSQYQWDELGNADDIVVSEDQKKIFVLVGSKIYAIDIKS